MRGHRADAIVFALAFVIFGLVALALVWSGGWAYEVLARASGNTSTTFLYRTAGSGDRNVVIDLANLLDWHGKWAAYVTGFSTVPPSSPELFTEDELGHMADVRSVFRGAELVAGLAFLVCAFRVTRARRRGAGLHLLRDGALAAAGLVAAIGTVAILAFDALFLLFHEAFFPQGNFLFDPGSSNLIRLYPEWYWQGVTAGVGVSFIAIALLIAGGTHAALRRGSTTYTRAA